MELPKYSSRVPLLSVASHYQLFPAGDRERDFERRDLDREPPKKGNTVYVRGHGLTEEILRKAFSNVGDIMNVTMERNKK